MGRSDTMSTRERLLTSGAILIADRGFNGVSVREICKHAETSMNMIHHYFGSKDGLLAAIVEQFSSEVFAVPIQLLSRPPLTKEDFQSRVEMLFESTLQAFIDQREVMMVVVREQSDPPALPEYMARLSSFLDQAKEMGFVRKELDSEMITGFMLDRILNQVQLAPWIKRNYGSDLLNDLEYRRRWCEANLDVFVNGISP